MVRNATLSLYLAAAIFVLFSALRPGTGTGQGSVDADAANFRYPFQNKHITMGVGIDQCKKEFQLKQMPDAEKKLLKYELTDEVYTTDDVIFVFKNGVLVTAAVTYSGDAILAVPKKWIDKHCGKSKPGRYKGMEALERNCGKLVITVVDYPLSDPEGGSGDSQTDVILELTESAVGDGDQKVKDQAVGRSGKGSTAIDASELRVLGGLEKEVIAETIQSRLITINDCYEKDLTKNQQLRGKVVVRFTIDGNGKVLAARISQSEMNNATVEKCIVSNLGHWIFSKPKGGGLVLVSVPIIFSSTGR